MSEMSPEEQSTIIKSFMVKMGEDLGENALSGRVVGAILIQIQPNAELQIQHVGLRPTEVIGTLLWVKKMVLEQTGQPAALPGHSPPGAGK